MYLKNIENIFFDFDGVLADSVSVKTKAFYSLFLPYGKAIAEKVKYHHLNNGGISRFEKIKFYFNEYIGTEINQKELDDMCSKFSKLVVNEVVKAKEIDDAQRFLELNYRKMRFWVISATPTEELKTIIKLRGLSKYFIGLHGSPKKKYYWTEKIIKEYSLDRMNTLFIGDAKQDFSAAKHSRIKFLLVENSDNIIFSKNFKGKSITSFKEIINE